MSVKSDFKKAMSECVKTQAARQKVKTFKGDFYTVNSIFGND